MKQYEVFHLASPVEEQGVLVVGKKTYLRWLGTGEQISVLTQILNDGWAIEHFAVSWERSDRLPYYHFVVSREATV